MFEQIACAIALIYDSGFQPAELYLTKLLRLVQIQIQKFQKKSNNQLYVNMNIVF